MSGNAGDGSGNRRAQSEVIGLVLLLAITALGVGTVVGLGSMATDQATRSIHLDGAEHAMTKLDSQASLVGLGADERRRIEFSGYGSSATTRADADAGWLRIEYVDGGGDEETVLNETLGEVRYENGDTSITYQGGGVWRSTGNDTTMVSPPEVHYRGETLTLPLVTVENDGRIDGDLLIRKSGPTEEPSDLTNPITTGELRLIVGSEFYRAWGSFFERRVGGDVEYDHDAETATIRLLVDPGVDEVSGSIVATSGQTLELGNSITVDSYNSTEGPYSESESEGGTIVTAGGVTLNNKATIEGSVNSGGGEVSMRNKARITGDLHYTSLGETRGTVEGEMSPDGEAPEVNPVGSLIDEKVASFAADNDNDETTAIEDESFDDSASQLELGAGRYYVGQTQLDDELVLNTTNGNVNLVIDGQLQVDGGRIRVVGDGRANVYVDGDQVQFNGDTIVEVPEQRSTQLWLYGSPGIQVEFNNQAHFEGVVYAPDPDGEGQITLNNKAEVFGALVGTVEQLRNQATIHFDEALLTAEPVETGENVPEVTYLHVSVNPITVEEDD